ncbi:MAG: GTPase HflX [Candidatus Aminicenantes bacterium]|nr:GTPase HflX [Candidatus Aminicenantes bacterium]MCK5003824.1 GTPase HflX [Candidatus Aminicenantes bacterium]
MNQIENVLITGLFDKNYNDFTIGTILDEVISLVETAGGTYSGKIIQKGRYPDRSYLMGKGKVEEIETYIDANDIDMIVSMNPLSSIQQRNLEKKLDIKVIDRTRLILDIFALHARTLEGKLQVELAQLLYMLPRLIGKGIELSRLGGGIGTRGPGETKLESDRRVIKKKISIIKKKLEKVRGNRALQRKHRQQSPVPLVSIVGYTSAGKSTLFNLLTNEAVFVTKKLFSTLDPLVRRVDLREKGKGYYCLMSDTVGFIRDMPEELLTSFYATLEEINESDIILLLSDISDPDNEKQISEVLKVLRSMNVDADKIITVYNKIDNLDNGNEMSDKKDRSDDDAVYISAKMEIGITKLKKIIFNKFFRYYDRFRFSLNKSDTRVNSISKWAIVLNRSYKGEVINFDVLCDREKMVKFSNENKEI